MLAAVGWLLWRRRERLRALPPDSAPWLAAILAVLGAACFLWALLTQAADLFFPALAAHLLAVAAAVRGRAGCRALALPAAVALLGVRIPAPLLDELVWRLQLSTAAGAAWLLEAIGRELVHAGVLIRDGEHSFHVIDGCSGLQGIEILVLVALLVRELFARSGPRQWLLVGLAPFLGFGLNVLRIAYVAASPDPEALAGVEGDHTLQGVAVLVAGTGLIYALGWWMARAAVGNEGRATSPPAAAAEPRMPWGVAAAGFAVLALIPTVATPFARGDARSGAEALRFPDGGGWSSESLATDPFFVGVLPATLQLHRRFELNDRPPRSVELFVGRESEAFPDSSRLLSSKLARPGPGWDLLSRDRQRVWMLRRDVDVSVARHPPGGEHALVYTWRLRDRGLWWESWRSLLALDRSPFARERARTVVQLLTYAPHDGSLALDRAKQRLDRFVADFREALLAL